MASLRKHVSRHAQQRYRSCVRDIQTSKDYLEYVRINDKDVTTTIFRGTLYELYAKEFLEKRLNCYDMTRVGGAGDNGVDVFGKWNLNTYWKALSDVQKLKKYPRTSILTASKQYNDAIDSEATRIIDLESSIQVFVQCKNYKKRIQPATIREIAGVYDFHAKTALDRMKSFFFLLSPFPLTKQAHRQFDTSPVPLLHLKIPSSPVEYVDEDDESVDSFGEPAPIYINQKARKLLRGLEAEIIKF
ncbi:uncharacterized protein CXQ87_000571 [Candidozyma duobushaemuli]|uniref:Required for respiratory growth protein 7, mitochondrial n=1 Tax=Candidozyma duobushaemuli TaxID=1231522 RepID=A0A2V1AIG4_9ASCO|nr:uncharacterized protein CXQ87_000571 [[Candida] duobushaemulonis]PVH17678.1 hypothetical protein CXQ87_000571 [[Candida] duobushaemulonis]